MRELAKKPEVSLIRVSTFHFDIVLKEMTDPKKQIAKIKDFLKEKKVDKKYKSLPPYDPSTNLLKQPAKDAYNCVMDLVADTKEDVDERVAPEYRPVTK